MKKRLISLLLPLAICFGIMPMVAFAGADVPQPTDNSPTLITEPLEATLEEPKIGEVFEYQLSFPDGAPYYVLFSSMNREYLTDEGHLALKPCMANEALEAGVYEIQLAILADDGYQLPESIENMVVHLGNQKDWIFLTYEVGAGRKNAIARGMFYLGDVPERKFLTDINLQATIKEPQIGGSPDYSIELPADAKYTAKVEWIDWKTGQEMKPEEKFEKNHGYRANVRFFPKDEYYFSVDTPTITAQVSDEKGLRESELSTRQRGEYQTEVYYHTDDLLIDTMALTIRRPKVGDKVADMPPVSIPDDLKKKYEIVSTEYLTIFNYPFETFGEGRHYLNITVRPINGYVWDTNNGSMRICDQYGEGYGCGLPADFKDTDPLTYELTLWPLENNVVVFHIENGYWADGRTTNKVYDLVDEKFSVEKIPTGMHPNEGYGNGSWDVDPATHHENLKEDTYFNYIYTKLTDNATVTLKIVNGQWSSEKAPTLTDKDIVMEVPLVDGKGSMDPSLLPNRIVADVGCLPNGTWDVNIDDLKTNVTEDITCTYTFPRVVTEPITHTVSFDGNGATSGEAPKPVSVVSKAISCSIAIPATTTLEKEDHQFAGWNTRADGSGTTVENSITVKYNEINPILYAQWEKTNTPDPTDPEPTDPKPDQKPDVKPDDKPDVKPDQKPDVKPDYKQDKPSDEKPAPAPEKMTTALPQTGDSSPILLLAVLAFLCAGTAAWLFAKRRDN